MGNVEDIPDDIKDDNWRLYELAMSADPALATQFAVKTVMNLKITMALGGFTEYEEILDEALNFAVDGLACYTASKLPGHEGEALAQTARAMEKVGIIVYDKEKRFVNRDKHAFTGRPAPLPANH